MPGEPKSINKITFEFSIASLEVVDIVQHELIAENIEPEVIVDAFPE